MLRHDRRRPLTCISGRTYDCRTIDDGEDIANIHEEQRLRQSCTQLRTEVVLEVALRANVLNVGTIPVEPD